MNIRPGNTVHDPEKLVGTFRRFGAVGPVYRVAGVRGPKSPADDLMMDIEVVETGERLDYSYWDILQDPVER